VARNAVIHIAVRDDVKERFGEIAQGYGMTMSALASYIIGQYVYNHEKLINPLSDEIKLLLMDKVKQAVEEQ
jgi:antitoxin component of RelBE/YafQ-DinJ toxin-antitoxin module